MLADTSAASRVAAATPAERDRFADLLRVASILVVVAGHWLMAVVGWRGGRVEGGNAIALVPGLWLATWLLQVMPLFFFVGGLANLVSARRGGGWAGFVAGRAARLLRPTVAFLAVWTVAAAVLGAAGVPEAALRPATRLVVQPLWFLGLYLLVVALAPAMLRLHRRFGPAVAVWLAVAAATADVAGRVADLPGLDRLGDLNFLLVWLFAHQLGFLYADGTLPGWPRRAHLAMAAGGLAALTVLTASGAWPRSMVGLPGDPVSNMNPPSLCIVALTIWLVGLAMLVRDPVTRWLHRPRPWALVVDHRLLPHDPVPLAPHRPGPGRPGPPPPRAHPATPGHPDLVGPAPPVAAGPRSHPGAAGCPVRPVRTPPPAPVDSRRHPIPPCASPGDRRWHRGRDPRAARGRRVRDLAAAGPNGRLAGLPVNPGGSLVGARGRRVPALGGG